ncbi:MAG: DUF819 family protein [Myxococcaceae bacterium]
MILVAVVLALGVPLLIRFAATKVKVLNAIGPVVLCYGAGIVLANSPWRGETDHWLQISQVMVPLAIPLLLFSTELKRWLGLARSLLLSFALACVSAMAAAGLVGVIFRKATDEYWKIAGMLVGVYVGGTANMSAIGTALGARKETFLVLNASDVLVGGAYLLFLLTVAQRLFQIVLPKFKATAEHGAPVEGAAAESAFKLRDAAIATALSVAIVGGSAGASFAIYGSIAPTFTLLALTTLGIAASLFAPVRKLNGSFEAGEFFLLVFCFAVGALADVRQVSGASLTLFSFVVMVMTLSIVFHLALSAAFRLDADTTLITSTATIFGPPFIGPVAAALKNRHLVGPGLTMGLAGIALGTYLGLGTAWLLRP